MTLQNKSGSLPDSATFKAFLLLHNGQVFPLPQKEISIGRSKTNHLALEDLRVSRLHARLMPVSDRYLLIDLKSTGGTEVNGRRIDQKILESGDQISLGGFSLSFGDDPASLEPNFVYYQPPPPRPRHTDSKTDLPLPKLPSDE